MHHQFIEWSGQDKNICQKSCKELLLITTLHSIYQYVPAHTHVQCYVLININQSYLQGYVGNMCIQSQHGTQVHMGTISAACLSLIVIGLGTALSKYGLGWINLCGLIYAS